MKANVFWHQFYKRNLDHFYKDRHYLHVVFPDLLTGTNNTIVCGSKLEFNFPLYELAHLMKPIQYRDGVLRSTAIAGGRLWCRQRSYPSSRIKPAFEYNLHRLRRECDSHSV